MREKQTGRHEEHVIPVVEETLDVGKRTREDGSVRVRRETHERLQHVEEQLLDTEYEVVRVPREEFVTAAPAVREDGDVTVIPVLEERLVVEKRLFLREEIHVIRRRNEHRYTDDVPVRVDEVTVERSGPHRNEAPGSSPAR